MLLYCAAALNTSTTYRKPRFDWYQNKIIFVLFNSIGGFLPTVEYDSASFRTKSLLIYGDENLLGGDVLATEKQPNLVSRYVEDWGWSKCW